jgi:hypothetical protein
VEELERALVSIGRMTYRIMICMPHPVAWCAEVAARISSLPDCAEKSLETLSEMVSPHMGWSLSFFEVDFTVCMEAADVLTITGAAVLPAARASAGRG